MRIKIALLLAFLAAILVVTSVSALWYSGVEYPNVYGVFADIKTPATAVPIVNHPAGA